MHYPHPVPLLPGATPPYALNTVNLQALETILCAFSMIGGEEGRCLAIATTPNKNLNSFSPWLWRRTWPTSKHVAQSCSSNPDRTRPRVNLVLQVKAPLITVCRLGYPCKCADITSDFSFQRRLRLAAFDVGELFESCKVAVVVEKAAGQMIGGLRPLQRCGFQKKND